MSNLGRAGYGGSLDGNWPFVLVGLFLFPRRRASLTCLLPTAMRRQVHKRPGKAFGMALTLNVLYCSVTCESGNLARKMPLQLLTLFTR